MKLINSGLVYNNFVILVTYVVNKHVVMHQLLVDNQLCWSHYFNIGTDNKFVDIFIDSVGFIKVKVITE